MRSTIIMPARWGSTRFPGKLLVEIAGKPLLQHTWERCTASARADQVIIATDDMRIAEAAFAFGAEVALTSRRHPSGSDRIAEVAARLKKTTHVLNVQGDEPTISPKLIDRLIDELAADRSIKMITGATVFRDVAEATDPNNVKVVVDRLGNAMYFSRALIPHDRDGKASPRLLHHMGIYGYKKSFLLKFVGWPQSSLEKVEKLEQLRALENGATIRVLIARERSIGVDVPADLDAAREILER